MSEETGDAFLDKEVEKGEIAKCVRKLKNNKTGGSDGIVGELLKYGGSGMVDLLEQLFSVIWQEEIVPGQWRDSLINPWRACAARVTVVVLCVCMCVCLSAPFRPLQVKVSPENDTNASSRQEKENKTGDFL